MSSSRTALARTYRPRRFAEITAQQHVSETLRSAVTKGRTAHAYLFCGPRGVGKTTAARVLAMALNCENRGEDGEPCGVCGSCERIWAGKTSLDVVEIDAASNRGVDDARELRERAMYAPTDEKRFKVYIIDEAHMLTREAWNALLKILEEPPPRVIFVLATTEPQKIQQQASAILSRCQRFDFRRVPVPDIVARLRTVLAAEGIEAGDDALLPIARRADGGMRDALSLLDQVLSFSEDRVSVDDARLVLGWVDDEVYLDLFDILAQRRHADVFRFVQRLVDEGHDVSEFQRGLADFLRGLLIVALGDEPGEEIREDLRARVAETAANFAPGDLLRMLAAVSELDVEGRLRKSTTPRTMLEVLLLRFSFLDRTVEIESLLGALGEGRAGGGPTARAGERVPEAAPRASSVGPGEPGGRGVSGPSAAAEAAPVASAKPSSQIAGTVQTSEESRVKAALDTLVAERADLPSGFGIFLRVAQVSIDQPDKVRLAFPPGPAFETLEQRPAIRTAIERALADKLGREVTVAVASAAPGGKTAQRLTPDVVRQDRLDRLAREKPALARAVEEWDLELFDDPT